MWLLARRHHVLDDVDHVGPACIRMLNEFSKADACAATRIRRQAARNRTIRIALHVLSA
jgi:hypothetical protein